MPYYFETPTVSEGPAGGHRLFQFRKLNKGVTVVRVGTNTFEEIRFPTEDYLRGREYWLGGHRHIVSDTTAAQLTAGGYAAYLTVIP